MSKQTIPSTRYLLRPQPSCAAVSDFQGSQHRGTPLSPLALSAVPFSVAMMAGTRVYVGAGRHTFEVQVAKASNARQLGLLRNELCLEQGKKSARAPHGTCCYNITNSLLQFVPRYIFC